MVKKFILQWHLSEICNLKCKHCYIERNPYKNEEDFISIEKIKQALIFVKGTKLNSIYLTGGEPLMHPEFNQILRMCLKISNTTVLSRNSVLIIMYGYDTAGFSFSLGDGPNRLVST